MKKTALLSFALAACVAGVATRVDAQGVISTFAGCGASGYSGDGGAATAAWFSGPTGVATDGSGNVYIADKFNHKVRVVNHATNIITTYAGNGSAGYIGIGGPATDATVFYPNYMGVDHLNNVYFTDWFDDAAFVVNSTTHYIMNHCGHDDIQGYSGDGDDASLATMEIPNGIWIDNTTGDSYIVDAGSNHIRRVSGATHIVTTLCGGTAYGYSGDGGPATAASFTNIGGVASDGHGNVYIADKFNHVIRKIDQSGTIFTIAGTGVAGYSGDNGSAQTAKLNTPTGLFYNNHGYLFICDQGNNVIRALNTYTDMIYTLAGTGIAGFSGDGGLASAARLNDPTQVWQDETSGVIYIADGGNNRIRKIAGAAYKATPSEIAAATATEMNIFPNPSNGSFEVSVSAVPSNATIDIFNLVGQKVYSSAITKTVSKIDMNVPTGLYNVVVTSEAGVTVKKVNIVK
jgi:trimeric autotransporter adhesin